VVTLRLNIVFVSEPLFPVSATASRTLNFAKALVSQGHNVHIFTLRESVDAPLEEMVSGCHIIRFGGGVYPVKFSRARRLMYLRFFLSFQCFFFLRALLDVVKTCDIDVVHCANYFTSLFGVVSKFFGVAPVVGDLHASAMIEGRERRNYLEAIVGLTIELLLVRLLDGIVSPTLPCIEYFEGLSSKEHGLSVVPSCVDLEVFSPGERADIAVSLRNVPDDLLLFYYGSPYPENVDALRMFVEIIGRLVATGFGVRGVVAGDFGKDEMRSNSVRYTGWLSQEELADHLGAVDICIVPLLLESKGISTRVIECMASGTATITTKNGVLGLESAVEKGHLLVSDSVDGIVKQVMRLSGDRVLLSRIGTEAREYIEVELSPASVARKLESVYISLIRSHTSP